MADEEVKKQPKENKEYISTVGRRRESVARVRIYKTVKDGLTFGNITVKKGSVIVNGKAISEYFSLKSSRTVYEAPFNLTNTLNKFATTIKVTGGGSSGQLGAVVLGLARALSKLDPENRSVLKKKGLLERDARSRQRRNVGMGGKSRRKRQSPKR